MSLVVKNGSNSDRRRSATRSASSSERTDDGLTVVPSGPLVTVDDLHVRSGATARVAGRCAACR
jgi:hypothetical protein